MSGDSVPKERKVSDPCVVFQTEGLFNGRLVRLVKDEHDCLVIECSSGVDAMKNNRWRRPQDASDWETVAIILGRKVAGVPL